MCSRCQPRTDAGSDVRQAPAADAPIGRSCFDIYGQVVHEANGGVCAAISRDIEQRHTSEVGQVRNCAPEAGIRRVVYKWTLAGIAAPFLQRLTVSPVPTGLPACIRKLWRRALSRSSAIRPAPSKSKAATPSTWQAELLAQRLVEQSRGHQAAQQADLLRHLADGIAQPVAGCGGRPKHSLRHLFGRDRLRQ